MARVEREGFKRKQGQMMKPARKKPFERKVAARVKKSVAFSHWRRAEANMPALGMRLDE